MPASISSPSWRLAHRASSDAGEMLGQDGGEGRRHVLGDQHRRAVEHAADLADDGVERLRAAGRGADHQHARRRRRHRPQCDRSRVLPGRGSNGSGATAACRAAARVTRAGPQPLGAQAELTDLLDQLAAELGEAGDLAIAGRLRNVVGGAERQRAQADLGVAPGQRRGHDHDEIALFSSSSGSAEMPSSSGISTSSTTTSGSTRSSWFTASRPVRSEATSFEIGLRLDPAREQTAHDDRVVHDHDADAPPERRAR